MALAALLERAELPENVDSLDTLLLYIAWHRVNDIEMQINCPDEISRTIVFGLPVWSGGKDDISWVCPNPKHLINLFSSDFAARGFELTEDVAGLGLRLCRKAGDGGLAV